MNGLGMWNWVKFHLQFFRLSTAVGILRYLTGVFPWKFKFKHRAMHFNIFYYIYVLFHLQYDTYVYIIHTCIYIYLMCIISSSKWNSTSKAKNNPGVVSAKLDTADLISRASYLISCFTGEVFFFFFPPAFCICKMELIIVHMWKRCYEH